jgi:hypothetical protein
MICRVAANRVTGATAANQAHSHVPSDRPVPRVPVVAHRGDKNCCKYYDGLVEPLNAGRYPRHTLSARAYLVRVVVSFAVLSCTTSAWAQIDQQRASQYFNEAASLCAREGGRLWGISLCGPIAIGDPVTHGIATSQPAPDAKPPAALGFANAATDWGGVRWVTLVWQMIPADERARARLMLHELFHRIQPQLGFVVRDGSNDHLDTLDGRYWMQLEWRALAKALSASGSARAAALRHALAFRVARRTKFPGAAENERLLEMNEGLAQYTGTVASVTSSAEAAADAIDQLAKAAQSPTFVRTFAYPSGAAYGILLDEASPEWRRALNTSDDLGQLLMVAARIRPAEDAEASAKLYGGSDLRTAEELRDAQQKLRVAELRRRFVEGPVIVLPPGRNASFVTSGMTPIPGAGTVYSTFRTTAEWGSLDAASVLVSADRKLMLPAPASTGGTTLKGDGWTLQLALGWVVRPGSRPGDVEVVRGSGLPYVPK